MRASPDFFNASARPVAVIQVDSHHRNFATYANVSCVPNAFVKANLVLVTYSLVLFGQSRTRPSSYWDNLRRAREPSPVRVGLQFCSRKLPICPCFLAAVKILVTFTFGLRAATGIHIYISYITYTSRAARGGGGSFKNRKRIGEIGCCESRMTKRKH